MDEARGIWHSLGLLLQAAWPTLLLVVLAITCVVAGACYARTPPRAGRPRARPPSAERQHRP
jgi:hypothetical protein